MHINTMKKNIFKNIIPAAALLLTAGMTSCVNDLDKGNIDPTVETEANLDGLYTKCYAGLIMEGNDGAADFSIDDAGKSTLIRNIYNFNELPTDESICWWSDGGIVEIGYNQWEPGHASLKFLYYRIMSNITFCNKFLKEVGEGDRSTQVAEVRFLRAYHYYLLMDFFGDPPFIDESSLASTENPVQAHAMNGEEITDRKEMLTTGRKNLYAWIMAELDDCEADLIDAKPNTDTEADYGRVDKASVWFLKSRLLLNSNIYLSMDDSDAKYQANLQEVVKLSDQIAAAGYSLCTKTVGNYHGYDLLFMGDNGSNGAQTEAILPLMQDGKTTNGWGGSLFFIACHWNANLRTVTGETAGTTGNTWAGMRCRPTFVNRLCDADGTEGKTAAEIREAAGDDRALFCGLEEKVEEDGSITYTSRSASLGKNTDFSGVASVKWNNNYSTGASPHDTYYVDTDFLLFRYGETVLNKAEALLRLGMTEEAIDAVNELRERANTSPIETLTMDNMLDERAREMYLEGMRRVDLIRFHQFGGQQATYIWEFKGGVASGINFDEYRNVYPIPTSEIDANSNLTQIYGY